ncbi:MAG: hypothetical protein II533_04610, partial [Bacteroidales bacterium]|nr:hypothetical protein [Bacteroidales bacterium]
MGIIALKWLDIPAGTRISRNASHREKAPFPMASNNLFGLFIDGHGHDLGQHREQKSREQAYAGDQYYS